MGRTNHPQMMAVNSSNKVRSKINKPGAKFDGSSSRYGNMYADSSLEARGPGIIKPHHLEELHLRSTHYGGAVDKLLTTQKIGTGFKGLHNQIVAQGGPANNPQQTPQGQWPAPINFNKNTFQDMY